MNDATEHPIFYWHDSPGNRFRVDVADFDEAAECPHCVPVYSAETVDRLRARVAELEAMTRSQSEQFEQFVLAYTGRDIAYHVRNKTVGIEFARACWEKSASVDREGEP